MDALKVEIELPVTCSLVCIPESELGRQAKEWIVLELFLEEESSADKIRGTSKGRFLDLLNARRLPCLDTGARLGQGAEAAEAAAKANQHYRCGDCH